MKVKYNEKWEMVGDVQALDENKIFHSESIPDTKD